VIDLNVDRQELHKLWDEVLDSSHFTEGKMVRRFEDEVEKYYGLHAIAVSNCGAGLQALYSLLNKRDPLALPNNTFFATGGAARAVGITDFRLIDTAIGSPNVGVEEVMFAAQDAAAVVITHVGGWVTPDYPEIAQWCVDRNVALIEDAAHAIGVRHPGGAFPGSLGLGAVFSLYPTKAMPVGEGGVIVTPDRSVAEWCRKYRNYGKYVVNGEICYTGEGLNLRMDEWTAAIALLQMRRLPELLDRRQEDASRLMKIIPPHPCSPRVEDSNWYKYIVTPDFGTGLPGRTGMVYRREDQLQQSMGLRGHPNTGRLNNSEHWAKNHDCLIVGEADLSSKKSRWELFTNS